MLSGLLMMFAVFGLLMWIGAVSGDNDEAAFGNMLLCFVMTTLMLSALAIGLRMRNRMQTKMDLVIQNLSSTLGHVDATLFAKEINITLDDARDVLDKRARTFKWRRTELEHYDARYFLR